MAMEARDRRAPARRSFGVSAARSGFTLIELMIVVLIISLLASIGVARTQYTLEQAKYARVIGDLRALAADVQGYQAASVGQSLPPSLAAVDRAGMKDPWGRAYVYVNLQLGGTPRTDVFGVAINTEYDLYSLGPDGASALSLTAGPSQDDVIVAASGGFLGRANRY